MSGLRTTRWPAAILLMTLLLLAADGTALSRPWRSRNGVVPVAAPAAVVSWPPSSGLLVSEVVTGGASASDEFVEIYNASSASIDLGGLELVYVTASGSTITRKQTWTQLLLPPGRHLLLANSAGTWASLADGLYSGGFAATGGSLVLRPLGGQAIDSLSWGDAVSAHVEGTAGPAPAAASSLERLPGGALGNGLDTNDNVADTHIEPAPTAQNLAAPPVFAPAPTPSATLAPTEPPAPTAEPTPVPDPTLVPDPTFIPDPTLAPDPTPPPDPTLPPEPTSAPTSLPTAAPTVPPTAAPSPSAVPTNAPTAAPTAPPTEAPTAAPTAIPTATPTAGPTSSPAPSSLAAIRGLALGSSATVRGVLTTPLGLTDSGKGAFVEDATAGIALYLPQADWPPLPAGTTITATGTLETRFSQLSLRLHRAADLVAGPAQALPDPLWLATGAASEAVEGRLVSVEGTISDGITTLSDGYSTMIDDGSGGLRVVVAGAAGIPTDELRRGLRLVLTGVVGQRDSTGTGVGGYRLNLRSRLDVVPVALPEPTPDPSASPSPTPAPSTSPAPSPRPTTPMPIADARALDAGQAATIRGVVTARPGRILGEQTIAVQDSSGGVCIRVAGPVPGLAVGRIVEATGTLAAPYGNLELRAPVDGLRILGNATPPQPRTLAVTQLGESTEGLLARVAVTIERIEASATSLTLIVEDESGEGRIFIHAAVGLDRRHFTVGSRIEATGIVGDRSGLYRLWPREPADIRLLRGGALPDPQPTPTSSPGPTGSPDPDDSPPVISIASALRRQGTEVTVEGSVTAAPGLLDADGRRVTIEDGTAGVLVRLPADAAAPALGRRLRVTGEMETYYGAPQIGAETVTALGSAPVTAATVTRAPLGAALEWRLVTVSGEVLSVHRDGDAWRAELGVGGGSLPIVGLARSGIPSTALVAGRRATVRGVVKRAYPTSRDQRLAIVPRSPADIALGAATSSESGAPGASPASGEVGGAVATPGASIAPGAPNAGESPIDTTFADLAAHEGARVRVGGRVESVDGARLFLRDGTAAGVVRLVGSALSVAPSVRVAAVLNATGVVNRTPEGSLEVIVDQPQAVAFIGTALGGSPGPSPTLAASKLPLSVPSTPVSDGGMDQMLLLAVAIGAALAAGGSAFAVARYRRSQAERLSAARIQARLGQEPSP